MSVSTAQPPRTAPRTHRRWRTARGDLAQAYARIARMISEARHRYRRPSLVISSFGCLDAAAWHTYGLGAGLLALGISLFVYEAMDGEE